MHWRTLFAALAVLSTFLLQASLVVLLQQNATGPAAAPAKPGSRGDQLRRAQFSTLLYGIVATASSVALLSVLPVLPLLMVAGGPILFMVATLHPVLQRRHYDLWFELASVPALTSSALLGNFAAASELRTEAVWIWCLFIVQMTTSVLVVRAQLGFPVGQRNRFPVTTAMSSLRLAVTAEILLWIGLAGLTLQDPNRLWLPLSFLLPSAWHSWVLWQLASGRPKIPPRRLGLAELCAAMVFSLLVAFKI